MSKPRTVFRTTLMLTLLTLPLLAVAQADEETPAPTPKTQKQKVTSSSDRFYLAFIEDATVVDRQWWEGQLEFRNTAGSTDLGILRVVAGFQPIRNLEVGGRVGFGASNTESPIPSGSGATDLDAWIKYYFGAPDSAPNTEFAVGSKLILPIGDDTSGLGTDSFGMSVFGTLRHRLRRIVISAHVGIQFNDDGSIHRTPLNGQVAALAGVGVIAPLSDHLTVVGELDWNGERFENQGNDLRLLGGINWHLSNRGMLRAALGFGLTSGAPDFQAIVGYAAHF